VEIEIPYTPFPYQRDFHNDNTRFRIIAGGRRVGKSVCALHEMIKHALTISRALAWWIGPTYSAAREVGYLEFKTMEESIKPLIKNISDSIMRIEFINGSMIYFKGADREETLRGRGLTFLVIDEAAFIKPDVWYRVLRPALSDKKGKAVLVSSPNGRNWYHDQYTYAANNGEARKAWSAYHWPSKMSPLMTEEDLEEARATLSPSDYAQEYGAEFVTRAGQVYADFNEDNIINDFNLNKTKYSFYIAADWGYANPSAIGFFAVANDGEKVVLSDEIYVARKTIEQLYDLVMGKLSAYNLDKSDIQFVYTDPAGNAEELTSGISPVDYLRDKGFLVQNKGTEIYPGLQMVRRWVCDANGIRRFFIHSRCKESIRSMYGYTYEQQTKSTRDLFKEEPMKDGVHDHACDMIRYFFVNCFDQAKYVAKHIPNYSYTQKRGKMVNMKRCSRCGHPFVSRTPKGMPPYICRRCRENDNKR